MLYYLCCPQGNIFVGLVVGMDPSFTQLLNDGVYNDNEQMNSQTPVLSQSQDMPSKSKKGRSKNFTIQEDILLISAWKNVSLDPIQGNNQTQQTYWSRITSYYNEYKTFPSERTPSSLCNRWSSIQLCVSKFQGFYNQIEGRNQSGVGEEDKVCLLILIYANFCLIFMQILQVFIDISVLVWCRKLMK